MVPFNLRPLDEPLPSTLGNEFGLVYLPLPVGIRRTRDRLAAVKRAMDEIKDSPEGAIAYGILGLVGLTPVEIEKLVVDLFTSKSSMVVTNVPGPKQPIYLAGTRVRGVLVWAPTSGSVAMSVSILSYDGRVTVGVMADAHLVPDPGRIADGFERELGRLRRAYLPAGARGTAEPPSRGARASPSRERPAVRARGSHRLDDGAGRTRSPHARAAGPWSSPRSRAAACLPSTTCSGAMSERLAALPALHPAAVLATGGGARLADVGAGRATSTSPTTCARRRSWPPRGRGGAARVARRLLVAPARPHAPAVGDGALGGVAGGRWVLAHEGAPLPRRRDQPRRRHRRSCSTRRAIAGAASDARGGRRPGPPRAIPARLRVPATAGLLARGARARRRRGGQPRGRRHGRARAESSSVTS